MQEQKQINKEEVTKVAKLVLFVSEYLLWLDKEIKTFSLGDWYGLLERTNIRTPMDSLVEGNFNIQLNKYEGIKMQTPQEQTAQELIDETPEQEEWIDMFYPDFSLEGYDFGFESLTL